MATFNFGFGAEVKFMQAMAIGMYAFLPTIIKSLIATVLVGSGGGGRFTFQNPVASNLGWPGGSQLVSLSLFAS